ncbi:MAG TPA: LamG-like jellyroll fold domain-containing protein, partial [Verrucomicrobiae bacterium]|nr:LamG-like jellyroll fold domain-containing protein [Verrucomicrobiae bacterium]
MYHRSGVFLWAALSLSFLPYFTSAQTCTPPGAGLSSWWPAEGSAADIVGGNPGALQGGATFAAGEVGQAFSFDGATGWVDIPNAAPFNPAGPFAVECWIKANPSQASGLFLIVDKSHGFTDSTGWLMQGGTDGTVSFGFGLGGGGALNFPAALTTNSVLDNQWHHLAGVFTGAAIQIYRDGVMEGSVAEAQLPVNNSRDVEIGRSWGGGSPTRFFNGLIDEVSYYNAALSPADVQAIYQAGSAGKCAPASVLWIAGNCSIGNSNYVTGGFLNAGVIRLESASCGVTSAITITNGALTNALNGLINVNPGSGGARTFAGSLENYGAFNDNYGMSFASNNAIIDNYGSFEIAAGQTLTISGQAQTFNQDAGALAIDGAVLFQGMQFNYNGGVISGNSVYLPQSLLGFGPNGTNAATFILAGHNANFTGDISSGQTVWLRGDSFVNDNGIIRPANGFKNAGTLQLESANGGYETDLILTNGQVTNAVGGVINFNAGAGGARFFQGNLWNAGTVNNNVNVSYNQTGAFITNQGAFIIAAAPTVTFLNQTFVQNAGTLQLMGGNIFSHCAFDFKGGAILSNAVYLPQSQLNLGPAGTNPATFILAGQGANFTGDIWPGQTVWLRGDSYVGDSGIIRPTNGFNNSGTLRLESANAGYETDLIMTNGAVVNTASGVIAINAGAGGSRYFRANLFNFGAFSNNTAVTFDQAGVTLDNEGLFVTAPGVPITFNNQTFSQNNGSLVLNGSDIFNHSTFNYGGGIILSNAIYLPQSQLNLSPAATNPATFILAGQSANFSGDIGPNETIWFRGDSTVGETSILRPAHGFKNAGLLRLESANAGYETDIVLTNGVLTNLAGGVVAINPGAGGLRYFRGSLQNFGAFSNNVPVGFDQSGATLDNEGLFVVGPSSTVTLAGQNFLQNAGALQLDGAMTLNSSTFDFRGGAVTGLNGAPYLISSALHLESTAVNPASFILAGSSSTLTGDIRAGQTIWLRGDNNTGGATITFTNGFSNAGALRLESFNQGWESSISVQNGSLTNTATGVININQGYGGPRNVTANITNNGTVNLNFGAVWTASRLFNFGAWNVNYTSTLSAPAGGAIWENDNALNVAAGQTLTLNGAGAPVFNQQSGFLTLDGGLTMNNGIFNYNGGAINGASATVYLQYSALHLTPTGTSPATFILTGTAGSAVTGDIRAGQTVWIRGDNNGGHTAVTVASGFRNQGALRLESFNQGWDSSLYLTSGVLTNLPGGMVTVNQGAGGPRTLGASFVNQGAFNVNWNLTVSGLNGVYENDGVFDIGTNETLTINNQNQTFNQNAGGILTIDGGANLTGITFNYNGGLINGQNNAVYLVDGNLNLGANALNPASFIVSQTGSVLTGDIKAGQSVWIRGDNSGGHTTLLATNGFRNSGNLRLESINQGWTSALSVTGGTLTNAAGGVIDVNLGANGPRGLSANIVNLGAVNINFSGSNPMLIGLAGGGFVNQGTFTLAGGQTASIAGQYSQTAGLTTLNGVLSTTNVISIQGGAMAGTGTISGNYQQGAGGALDVSLAGPVPSHLAISGVATLAGKLQVTLANSFVPTNGSAFTVLSAASLNGAFSSFDLPPLAGGLTWQVDYQAGAVVLSVPPAASTNNTRTISGVVTNTQGAPVAGATVYAYADPTVQTNLIINGGFETPSVGGSSYIIFAPGATNLTGWTVLGPSSVDISAGFLGAAEEGSQYFDPTGDLNSGGGGVSQTYPTVPGLSYNLIFFNGAYSLHNLNSLGVTNNGVFYSIPQPSSGPGLRWTRQVIPFVATSNFTTVAFINLSGFNSDDCDVDNVQVLPANFDDVLSGVTDANGHYQIAVSDGIWQVNVAGLTTLGYAETTNQTVTLNGGNAVVNFSAAPFSGQYYNVTLQSSPVAAGIITGGGTYAAQASVTVNAAPNSGAPWIFTGWSLNGVIVSTNSTYTFTLANDLTLVATFALPSFTVAASNNPAGAGSINGLGTFVWGSTAMLTANPVFGYAFQHWSDNNGVQIGAARTLAVTVLSNAALAAVYVPTNLAHVVTTATAPPGLAVPTGAGSYTNGQPALFTAPAAITNGLTYYTFAQFNLNGSFASASASFPWTFATTDLTNWALTAVYNAHSVLPLVASAFGNSNSPVGATANFTVSIRFDRSMLTSAPPVILLTNSASAAQPVVPLGGLWSTTSALNDTFTTGPILLTNGMDGTVAVFVSGAADLAGDVMVLTNAFNFTLDATPPVISGVSVNPLALTAIVTWNTSEPATSQVDYGPTAAYGSSTPLDGSLVTSHSVTISGLAPSTGYHFRAGSHDLAGNAAASIDGSFTTLPAPDLQITNLTISPNLLSGGQATVSWIVTNTGTGATFNYWYDQVTVSNTLTGQTYFNTSVYYDPGASASIAGGGSRARQASFRLPDGTNGAGPLAVVVTANFYGSQYEINYANNTAAINAAATLALYPDLQILALAVRPSAPHSGDSVDVVWQDTNAGLGAIGAAFQDSVIVSNTATGAILVNGAVTYDAAASGAIGGGQTVARQFTFQLPNGAAGVGAWQIMVTADSGNTIFEYNLAGTAENNNTAAVSAASSLAPYADFVATNVQIGAGPFVSGGSAPISWTDFNFGTTAVAAPWTDNIYLSTDGTTNTSQLIGSFTFSNGLAAGSSRLLNETITLPPFVTGTAWIVVKANAANSVYELNTSNNAAVSAASFTIADTLAFGLSRTTFAKDAVNPAALGTITRNGGTGAPLTLSLASSDPGAVAVPSTVVMLAGQASVLFPISAVNDGIVHGTRQVTVTASAGGYASVSNNLTVLDSTVPALSLTISSNSIGDSFTNPIPCVVARNTSTASSLTVNLLADAKRLTVPATVIIPAGAASVAFNAYAVNDHLPHVNSAVTVTPTAP